MDLTKENKKYIDSLSYEQLLSKINYNNKKEKIMKIFKTRRFAPLGDPWFQGETGEYWGNVMQKKKEELKGYQAVAISKNIGWK